VYSSLTIEFVSSSARDRFDRCISTTTTRTLDRILDLSRISDLIWIKRITDCDAALRSSAHRPPLIHIKQERAHSN